MVEIYRGCDRAVSSALRVQDSRIPGAGMGLFAAEELPEYVVIGQYSGEVKDYARFGEKVQRLGHNHLHPFYLKPGLLVDPTDEEGALHPASLSMAFTNEAPPGERYNLLALYAQPCADQDPAVYFCTRERVPKGSELFVCYGYDHPREYPWADPDIDLDTHQRQQICQRHPHLSPEFPPKDPLVQRPQDVVEEVVRKEPVESHFEVGTDAWRTDFSDVVLDAPVYETDSE
ncbi:unnamed protein product [Durusdinium trenchii]|uniref:Uncharacterized protein n=2 Tax=Durusdinium trenchii TaxID=1381693 RepID=A0ABP0NYL5_9DINO